MAPSVLRSAVVSLALVTALGCATDESSVPESSVPATVATVPSAPASSPSGGDACALLTVDEIATALSVPAPSVLQSAADGCVFSFEAGAGGVGSVMRTDAEYGRDLLESFASYEGDDLDVFGMQRLERSDGVEGTFSEIGFVVVFDDATYQFAIDGTTTDHSDGMLALVDVVVARHG